MRHAMLNTNKKRVQLTLSPEVIASGMEMARRQRRSFSNWVEVELERAAQCKETAEKGASAQRVCDCEKTEVGA